MLIIHDWLAAAIAANRVGYESASQFNREFKRFFGSRPMEESKGVRDKQRKLAHLRCQPMPRAREQSHPFSGQ